MQLTRASVASALLVLLVATQVPMVAHAAQTELVPRGTLEVRYGAVLGQATTEAFSTAAVGDITGDGSPDVVAGGLDGHLRAWNADGTLFLAHRLPGPGAVFASPTLVDFDGDGVLDVLVGNDSGYVDIISGSGHLFFRQKDCTALRRPNVCGVFGTPVVGDLDGDGRLEVVASSYDHHVYAWNDDGSLVPGFPRFLLDTLWSSPTLADLDGDGRLEIVVGGDIDFNYPGGNPYPGGGLLWVLRGDGSDQPGFPRSMPNQVTWSSPAVVDISGDGLLDIVVGTGTNFAPPAGSLVYAFDRSGRDLPGWPVATDGRVMGSPAVGDVDGNGDYEVAVLSEGGWLSVFEGTGGAARWRACNRTDRNSCDNVAPTHGSPVIADVDGDGQQEVISAAEHHLRVFSGTDGAVEADVSLGGNVFAPAAAPTVAQIGSEARIVLNTIRNTNDDGRRAAGDTQSVFVFGTGQRLLADDWPTFKQNPQRIASIVNRQPGPSSCPKSRVPEDGFVDVAAVNVHERSVDCAAWWAVTSGVGPGRYDPRGRVTRGQMATFIVRSVEATGTTMAPGDDRFADDDGTTHEANINKVAAAGIAAGRGDGTFGAGEAVTREQMATFLAGAAEHVLGAPLAEGTDAFSDDDGRVHEANINKVAAAGIARGVGGGLYAPTRHVTRDQMATFLMGFLGVMVDRGEANPPA